jgi:hypothetical protein
MTPEEKEQLRQTLLEQKLNAHGVFKKETQLVTKTLKQRTIQCQCGKTKTIYIPQNTNKIYIQEKPCTECGSYMNRIIKTDK